MIKPTIQRVLGLAGYEVHRIPPFDGPNFINDSSQLPAIKPIWPLPRRNISREAIIARFAQDDLWHYAYEFDGGLSFPARHLNAGRLEHDPRRHLQRFHHMMPASDQGLDVAELIEVLRGGTLRGKLVMNERKVREPNCSSS